jgi:ssDNA-binding Zn-finger/Zn-ribbon topoisomerase 1
VDTEEEFHLIDIEPEELSLVDRGANRKRFNVIKRDNIMKAKMTKERLDELKKIADELKVRAGTLVETVDGAEEVEKADGADESEVMTQARALHEVLGRIVKAEPKEGEAKCPKCGYIGEPDKDGKCPKCGAVMKMEAAVEKIEALERGVAGRDAAIKERDELIEKLVVAGESALAGVAKAKGAGGGTNQAGPGGTCECPKCGYTEEHKQAEPCTGIKCPKCGATMQRKGYSPQGKEVEKLEERIKALEEKVVKAEKDLTDSREEHKKQLADVKKRFGSAPGSQLPPDPVFKTDVGEGESWDYDLAETVRQSKAARRGA